MPHAKPSVPETYLCTSVRLDSDETVYITGFEPVADKRTAHHMIVFGCKTPGKPDPVFHCGAMDASRDASVPATRGRFYETYFRPKSFLTKLQPNFTEFQMCTRFWT
jgi:hypothetical protein